MPCIVGGIATAQPICSIDLGPDHTICQGESAQLTAPPGFVSYQWSNGSNAEQITVSDAGTYTCQVTYPSGQLVTNGNFSAGNTGFTTMFNYSPVLTTDGNYFLGSNAALYHPQFQGTGNGQFLMVNAGWMHAGWRFWCQTVPVCPGQTYTISFRAASLANQNPPTLAVFVNEVWTGQEFIPPNSQGTWQQFSTTWTAPDGVFTADVCVQVSSGHGVGNDFGFDDVSIQATVVLTDEVVVNVTPLPTVDLGPDQTLCNGEATLLDATVPGGSYLWQDGSTAATYNASQAGNYSVTVTASGCQNTDDVNIALQQPPALDLGPDLQLCAGETSLLDATTPGASYIWQDGSTAATYTVSQPGTYSVSVQQGVCTVTDAVQVGYTPLPVVDLGPDQLICAGGTATLDATTPGAAYLWSDGSSAPTLAVQQAGTYSVEVTVNGCSATDQVDVAVQQPPALDLGPDQQLCAGESTTLDATTPGATYLWQDGSTAPTFTVTQAGNYSVTVQQGACSVSDAVQVGYTPLPVVDLGADQVLCDGGTATLDATTPGAAYLWSDGSNAPTLDVQQAGTYSVEVTVNGCSATDQVDVAVQQPPALDLGPDQQLCAGESTTLDATTPGATYLWQDGSTAPTFTVTQAGNYSVTVQQGVCSVSDAVQVGYTPLPVVDLGADPVLCDGGTATLDATTPGGSYLWQDGSTAPTYAVTAPGTYTVDVTVSGCTASGSVQATYLPLPVVDLGADQLVCPGTTVVLDATAQGATYLWNTGSTAATLSTNTPGTYSVEVTVNGCTVGDAVTITNLPLPNVDIGPDQSLCDGLGNAQFSVNVPGATYLWHDGGTGGSFQTTSAGVVWVDVTLNGCTVRDSAEVFVLPTPQVDLGPDQTICPGTNTLLDASSPGATYLWNTGATTATLDAPPGQYTVAVSLNGCTGNDAITVGAFPEAEVALGNDTTLCPGENLLLDAFTAGATYLWSNGSSAATLLVSAAGSYGVTITDANGCQASDQISVQYAQADAIDLGPDITACNGQTVALDAGLPGATYLWSTGANTQAIAVAATGTYWVQAGQGPCTVSDTINVTILPTPEVDLGPDFLLCPGASASLEVDPGAAQVLWSDGSNAPQLVVQNAGIYWVQLNLDGCSASDTLQVEIVDVQTVDLGPDQTVCEGGSVQLAVQAPGADVLWSTGATTQAISVDAQGSYWVQVTVGGCPVSDTVMVDVIPLPVVDLGSDATICDGEVLVLDVTTPGASYLWSDGGTSAQFNVTQEGSYSVQVTVDGCTGSDAVNVQLFTPDAIELGDDLRLCPGNSVELDVTTPGATYLWQDGGTGPTFLASAPGLVWVEVSGGQCSVRDSLLVSMVPIPQPQLEGPIMLCSGDTVALGVEPGAASVLWSNGSTDATTEVWQAGTVMVTLLLEECITTASTEVIVLQVVEWVDLGDFLEICPTESLRLDATTEGATEYLWDNGSTGPVRTVDRPGLYEVHVTGPCIDAAGSVLVEEGQCAPFVFLPNAFSPNGDGINDVFRASVDGTVEAWELDIHDRWGARITGFTDPAQVWDGTMAGGEAPQGVYVWHLRYRTLTAEGVKRVQQHGHVTLLR